MKKFVLKNSETRFQNAETRFQNAKTALSRIFFARTGMDSAQKKPVLHRVKFLKTFEFGAQRGEGYRGESALLCSQFQTQF